MENWKNLLFNDISGGEFQLTHKTGKLYTVKVIKFALEGKLTIANPKMRLSENEFVMSEKRFENLLLKNIIIIK
jgi:hypothetical protein